jgi:hypothetical protein
MEKGRAYFLLELADLEAERRLLDTKPFGGPGEMKLFCDCDKIAKMTELHRGTIPQRYRN